MKKIIRYFIYIFILTIFITLENVNADGNISIESVTLVDKTETVSELSLPNVKDLSIGFDLSFVNVNDSAKYKIVIDNPTDKTYEISKESSFNSSEYLSYNYEFENDSNVVKKNSKYTMYITITYKKMVPDEQLVEGKYIENNSLAIDLSDEVNNPETGVNLLKYILILLSIIALPLILYCCSKTINKKYLSIIILLLLIPIGIYAIEKLQIKVETQITISKETIKCEAGEYLPKGTKECSTCVAGSFCPGGTYPYDEESDNGMTKCAEGSYSEANASACTACPKGGTSFHCRLCNNYLGSATWNTPIWNSDNTVSNNCSLTSCVDASPSSFTLINNRCIFTGTFYSFINSNIKVGLDMVNLSPSSRLSFTREQSIVNDGMLKYMYTITDAVNNVITNTSFCFIIGQSGIRINNTNAGEYCFKIPNSNNVEEIYQYNLSVAKAVFGENHPHCSETESEFRCVLKGNDGYELVVSKIGDTFFYHDDPDNDYSSSGNPKCIISLDGNLSCSSTGCLDGDTEVEVYDKKKKKET